MKNKKLDVHMVQHTHWDREWYFTSDDSRTMLYYDMKYLIAYLEKNDDKFTFDGQSSVIDDFLKYAPEWEERLKKVIKAGKLIVGPFYTQTDNVLPYGESILRNLEIGNKLANDFGKSMQVGYLPDTFGHNNQSPQILQMMGINNLSFYRGLDPIDTNDHLYFIYQGLDGSKVLGHWQTHYSTSGGAYQYTTEAFEKHVVADYTKKGEYKPSVKSYAKRNFNLPIGIPIGTDQRPFRKEVKDILDNLNQKYQKFHFIASDYETMIKAVCQEIKSKKIDLPIVTSELRQALTGRVHRSVLSSRVDIKQFHYQLETILVDTLEPLSIMCELNQIDVPWKMIEHIWKELFKSSAHDSYGTTNEDIVNAKLKQRLQNALRIAQGLIAMLTRIFAQTIINEQKDAYQKLILFNFDIRPYGGLYQFTTTVKNGFEDGKFKLFDHDKEVKYAILAKNNVGTHERDALTLLFKVQNVPAFSYKILDIKYQENKVYHLEKTNKISNEQLSLEVTKEKIILTKNQKQYVNFFKLAMDPSIGDTYDHSPITFNDQKYLLTNYQILEAIPEHNTIKIEAKAKVPSEIENWTNNKTVIEQKVTVQLTLVDEQIHAKILVKNKSLNGRMILLVDSISSKAEWKHDQQFGVYHRQLNNKYLKTWDQPNTLCYTWEEYPTNLSPHQKFISNSENTLTIYTKGTREHEMIEFENKYQFAITLYRAFGLFGNDHFAYRPGRASGAKTAAPDCQMLNDNLVFDFIFDLNLRNEFEQFTLAKQLDHKTYYIPGQWGLERTLLRWETNLSYYYQDQKRDQKFEVPKDIEKGNFILSALYQDPQKQIIARYLNLGPEIKVHSNQLISRKLFDFNQKEIVVPQYGLVNVLLTKE